MQNVRALLPPSFWVLVALAELIDQVRLIPEEGRLEGWRASCLTTWLQQKARHGEPGQAASNAGCGGRI